MRRQTTGLNLLLGVDKPEGLTSHDAVSRVRRALGERRVGHAGTLDPLATGVLVMGVGQGTRLMGLLTAEQKSYVASIAFGQERDTDDAEGVVVREAAVPERLRDQAFASGVVAGLVGEHEQVPPAYSAISVGGRRAYALAREGREVTLEPRHVSVMAAQLLSVETEGGVCLWQCAFQVSKGTYIRSIARDLGRDLGSAAYLAGLRRTASGSVTLASCVSLEEIDALGAGHVAERAIDPVRALGVPVREVSGRERVRAGNGQALAAGLVRDGGRERPAVEGERVALVDGGSHELVGVWRASGPVLVCDVNFPQGIDGVRDWHE